MILKNDQKILTNPYKMRKNQIIYGFHSVKAALLNIDRVHNELILHEKIKFPLEKYKSNIKKIKVLDHNLFKKLYGSEQSTQGIVLKTEDFERPSLEELIINEKKQAKSVIIVLDQITDPQNIGSIMRSCALFDCKAIVVAKDNSPDLTPSLLKAASGAAEKVNYFKVTNLRRSLLNFKNNGYWIYGFDSNGKENQNINFEKNSVFVFGSESRGIRKG